MAELTVPDHIKQERTPLKVLRTVKDVAAAHATFGSPEGEREEPCAVLTIEAQDDKGKVETFDLVLRLADLGGFSSVLVAAGCEVGALIAGHDGPEEG